MGLTRENKSEIKEIIKETVISVLDSYLDTLTEKIMLRIKERMEEEFKRLNFKLKDSDLTAMKQYSENLESRLRETEAKLDQFEQESKKTNVIVFGIPESDNADLKKNLTSMCQENAVNIDAQSIKSCYRLGKRIQNKTRPIIIKFTDEFHRDIFYSSRKLFLESKVFVKEDLTRKRIELFKYATEKFPKSVWTIDGNVKVRTEKGIITVKDREQLNGIVDGLLGK